jgi:tRNA (guanine10-N2)-dimethyltransferase
MIMLSRQPARGFVYVASFTPAEEEVAALELACMASARLTGRLARSWLACDIAPSAYTRCVAEIVAEGRNFEDLLQELADLNLAAEDFAVEVLRVPPRPNLSRLEVARRVADRIRGCPNLSAPKTRWAVVAQEGHYLLGRVVAAARRDWHDAHLQPAKLSSALPARLARALVNMVAAAGDTLIDPCCGVGTVLIEAHRVGARAFGLDINPTHVRQARQNLAYFDCPVAVEVGDARALRGAYDAAVVDLPYGRTSRADDQLYLDLVAAVAECVRRLVVVTGEDKAHLWHQLDLRIAGQARVPTSSFVRHIYLLAGRRP